MRTTVEWVDLAEAQGFPQRGAASEVEIAQIAPAFARQFGIQAPEDYLTLLRSSNGFDFDGIVVFGTHDQEDDLGFLPGVFDSNERLIHGSESIDTPLRFIGEAGDLLFAYDTTDHLWKAVSRYGWHTIFNFSSFGDLFDAAMATTQ